MNTALHFSTGKDDWQTPDSVFDPLRAEFGIEWDLAASHTIAEHANRKLPRWLGPGSVFGDDALVVKWHELQGAGWLNPPYSRGLQYQFIAKAAAERASGFTTVALLPARTDTRMFHDFIYNKPNVEVRFLKGRIKFVGAKHAAPFPSMVVIFHGDK